MANLPKQTFAAFGEVIYYYASAEFGIKVILGAMLGVSAVETFIITEPYNATALRNVAKSVTKESQLTAKQKQQFIGLVGEFGSFGVLRNVISHCRWEKGKRRGSWHPLGFDIRSGSLRLSTQKEDAKDWTTAEILEEAAKLRSLNGKLVMFYRESGLSAAMAAKHATIRASRESRDGSSTSAS